MNEMNEIKVNVSIDVNDKQDEDNDTIAIAAKKRIPFIVCINTKIGYENENPKECNNGKIFELLLNQEGIDLTVTSENGFDAIRPCHANGKNTFINKDINNMSNNKYIWQ